MICDAGVELLETPDAEGARMLELFLPGKVPLSRGNGAQLPLTEHDIYVVFSCRLKCYRRIEGEESSNGSGSVVLFGHSQGPHVLTGGSRPGSYEYVFTIDAAR